MKLGVNRKGELKIKIPYGRTFFMQKYLHVNSFQCSDY